jgi:hypothetical protein
VGSGYDDEPVHPAYNPSFSACFFQLEQYFSLTTNQSTVFFSRLISPTERADEAFEHRSVAGYSPSLEAY